MTETQQQQHNKINWIKSAANVALGIWGIATYLAVLTCFLFGFRDAQGNPHRVASRQMRTSGNEKSALFGFLKSMLGRAPAYGWDYCSLKGAKCALTVEHVQRRDGSGVFAAVTALSPVPAGLGVPAAQAQAVPSLPPPPPVAPVTQPRPQPALAVK